MSNRGIVIIAGDERYEAGTYVLVRLLLLLGCKTRICLYGEPFGALSHLQHAEWRPLPDRPEAWACKAPIIRDCGFDEVIYLDGDCYPTCDPSVAFDWSEFNTNHHAVFPIAPGPKGTVTRIRKSTWKAFGLVPMDGPFLEPCFVLCRPQQCKEWLDKTDEYGQRGDIRHEVSYGDCDWFQMGFRENYFTLPQPEHVVHTNLHSDPDGKPFLVHRYGDKFRLKPYVFASRHNFPFNQRHPALPNEDLCFSLFLEYANLKGFEGRLGGFPWHDNTKQRSNKEPV